MKIIIILQVVWAMYSGDVNQDHIIDLTDMQLVDNDVYNYAQGYTTTDLTGDSFVDLNDMVIVERNAFKFIHTIRP